MATHPSPATGRESLIDLDATFLPVGRMRQVSRVTRVQGPLISGEMDLSPDHWVWPEHFPGDPIFPGTLMLEGAGQLLALWAWATGARGHPRLVRINGHFHHPVGRDTRALLLDGTVERKRQLHFGSVQISCREQRIATVEAVLAVIPTPARPQVRG